MLLLSMLDALVPQLAAAVAPGGAEAACYATLPCTSASGCCSRPSFSTYAAGMTATAGDQSMTVDVSSAGVMCSAAGNGREAHRTRETRVLRKRYFVRETWLQ